MLKRHDIKGVPDFQAGSSFERGTVSGRFFSDSATGDLLTSEGVDSRPQLLGSIINAIFDVSIIRGPLRH